MKKIVISLLVIVMVAVGAVSLVGCGEKSLDGTYVEDINKQWSIVIAGDKISLYHISELEEEGTFTRSGNVLTTTLTYTEYFGKINIVKDGNLTHQDGINGDKVTTYSLVKK